MPDNPNMAVLYEGVSVGTPVTIVGALAKENAVALALSELVQRRDEI